MTDKPDPNMPLRLARAGEIAFPEGGMTVSGLRSEIAKGRLKVEIIAGKQFTTLAYIDEMRKLCLEPAKAPPPAHRFRASNPAMQMTPQEAPLAKLNAPVRSQAKKPRKRS